MKLPRALHSWSLTPRQAATLQRRMAGLVSQTQPAGEIRFIAGLDAAFCKEQRKCFAAVVLWDLRERRVVEQRTAVRKLTFPYVPGLLSFREAPVLLAALRQLRQAPDALLCDGHGVAHPRRFGLACHLGVICDLPAIGCAKSRLVGEATEPSLGRGGRAPLCDRGEILGSVLRTRDRVKPVFVSVGHKMDLAGAERLVLACAVGRRLPEPTRLADRAVAAAKRRFLAGRPRRRRLVD